MTFAATAGGGALAMGAGAGGLGLLSALGTKDNQMDLGQANQLAYAAAKGYGKQTQDIRLMGKEANAQYAAQMGLPSTATAYDISQLPGYQQAMQQGMQQVNQGMAGTGMTFSGQHAIDLQTSGQNIFGNYYSDYMNRLQGLGQQRMNAIGNKANLMMGASSQIGSNLSTEQQFNAQQNQQMTKDLSGGMGTIMGGGMPGGGGLTSLSGMAF